MKKIILLNLLILIFSTCDEPDNFNCYDDTEFDDCGVCCGGSSDIECSIGPNTGAMDSCGTCFGDNTDCVGCTDSDAINYDSQSTITDDSCIYSGEYINLDISFLIEENWCKNFENPDFNTQCNIYSTNEQDCIVNGGSPGIFSCDWVGTFEAKVGWPIYWLNSSPEDITLVLEEDPSSCKPIINSLEEQIVDNQIECILINNQEDCEEYNGQGLYPQNPCEWYTSPWTLFGQEIQTISGNTITNNEAEVFDGFDEPIEKTYQAIINGQTTEIAKIIVTQ